MNIKKIPLSVSTSKPGRSLTQWGLEEMSNMLGKPVTFPYMVRIGPGQPPAGNHFHKEKLEFFVVAQGSARVSFEDPETKEKAFVDLVAKKEQPGPAEYGVKVPLGIAHVVENMGKDEVTLLVFANRPARLQEDDFDYKVV